MRMLNFTVEGQRLKKEGDFSGIRAGSAVRPLVWQRSWISSTPPTS